MSAFFLWNIFITISIQKIKSQPTCDDINSTFPFSMDNTVCHGLYNVPTATTYQKCAETCCYQQGCEIYQFSPSTSKCWMGGMDYCTLENGWQSRARISPPTSHIWPLPFNYKFLSNT
eukprot:852481_1